MLTTKRLFLVILSLIMVSGMVMLSSCGKETGSGDNADDAALLDYRIADKSEGIVLLLSNDAYYDSLTQNDLDFKMQKAGADLDEYKAFAEKQVIDFTDEQKAIIDKHMEHIKGLIEDRGYKLPPLEQIVFINTTMKEECDAFAYTHGTHIFISGETMAKAEEEDSAYLDYIFAHEIFHCITRCNEDFRTKMYKIINFTTQEKDFDIPPSVKEYFISNPDVERHNSYATFMIGGKPVDCFTAFVTKRHFEKEGDDFFDLGTTALVPVDGTDKYYLPEDAENFDEVFGTNTDYVIDPEECMADNFGFLIAYEMDGPEGKGYNNPEIITLIEDVLKKK